MIAFSNRSINPSDQDLQHRVALFVQQRRLTSGVQLSVSAHRGVITLKGSVPTFHQRQLLISYSQHVAGVVQVIDDLEVDPESQLAPSRLSLPRESQPPKPIGVSVALAILLSLFAGTVLAGCSRSGPQRVTTHPVQGKITFQGQPIGGAFVVLHPKEAAAPDVPTSRAHVQPDGTFRVSTYDSADGAPAGEYVVTVQWQKLVKSGGDFVPGPNLLPTKYSNRATSDVVVHVAAGANELLPIVLKR